MMSGADSLMSGGTESPSEFGTTATAYGMPMGYSNVSEGEIWDAKAAKFYQDVCWNSPFRNGHLQNWRRQEWRRRCGRISNVKKRGVRNVCGCGGGGDVKKYEHQSRSRVKREKCCDHKKVKHRGRISSANQCVYDDDDDYDDIWKELEQKLNVDWRKHQQRRAGEKRGRDPPKKPPIGERRNRSRFFAKPRGGVGTKATGKRDPPPRLRCKWTRKNTGKKASVVEMVRGAADAVRGAIAGVVTQQKKQCSVPRQSSSQQPSVMSKRSSSLGVSLTESDIKCNCEECVRYRKVFFNDKLADVYSLSSQSKFA